MVLSMDGFEVETAYGGHEGVDAALHFNPDIILLDIGMPRLDGYDTCRRIREQSGAHPPRIVAVTGWGQENDRRRVKEAGFDGHLVKPVPVSAVLALLATVPR
jgi:DNA-binding response OmpR family regulator